MSAIRAIAAPYTEDRFFAPDIEAAAALIESEDFGPVLTKRRSE
jgi:histidine ammonia-lyase